MWKALLGCLMVWQGLLGDRYNSWTSCLANFQACGDLPKLHVRVPANEALMTDRNLPPCRQQPSPPSLFPTLWPKGISYLCQAIGVFTHSVISPHYHRFNLNLYPSFGLVNNRVSELKLQSCYRSNIVKTFVFCHYKLYNYASGWAVCTPSVV